ncbi:DNA topoisomerase 2 [Tanacetum coccineum]
MRGNSIFLNCKMLNFVMSRLFVMGQDKDKYGVFPLEGMLLNVREASPQELEKNTDIQNIKKILGLQDAPIVKASHKKTNKVFLFYSMPKYEAWKEKFGNDYNIKYYKGQETIQTEENGEYYFDQHVKDFVWENDEDGDAIELAFSNMKIEERKHWLQAPPKDLEPKGEKGIYTRLHEQRVPKPYAMADLQRSFPFKWMGLYVLNHSLYHDGVVTLVDTIIGMAQNYVGSNNINLLESKREFGTRWMGGKDHADVTLLFTRLSPITRYLFHKDDELLLRNYLNEDGQSIEPAWFIPIIPMVLVNGSEARGAWNAFKGKIQPSSSNEYTTYGIKTKGKGKGKDTELPVRSWTLDYYEFLEAASRGGKDIKYYKACNDDDTRVHFEITMTKDQMNKARQEEGELWNKLKLTTTLSTGNIYVLDAEGKLKKYDTPEELVEDFYRFRLNLYEKRKTSLPHELKIALLQNKSKERFARAVRNKEFDLEKPIFGKCVELKEKCFKTIPSIKREEPTKLSSVGHSVGHLRSPKEVWGEGGKGRTPPPKEEDEDVAVKRYDGYDYLISQLVDIFEPEYIEELEEERKPTDTKLQHLTAATPESLWLADLAALDAQLALVRKTLSLLIL